MSEASTLTWSCPACGRRVPRRIERCHCGRLRDAVGPVLDAPVVSAQPLPTAAPARTVWRSLAPDVKALVVVGALLTTGGVGWGLFGMQPGARRLAVLGYVDRPATRPTPPPPPRALKLPWWR